MTLLVLVLVTAACGGAGTPSGTPTIDGTVTHVGTSGAGGSVRIEVDPKAESGDLKLVLRVDADTRLYADRGGQLTRIALDEVRVGQRARAWVSGPIAESYPGQGRADAIVVR